MNTRQKYGIGLAVAAILVSLLSGCVVVPADPYYVGAPVAVAPPPPRVEVIGVPPVAGYIWINGYWDWDNGQHVWRPGQWEAPRRGHRWVPHRWEQDGSHWRSYRGYWEKQ